MFRTPALVPDSKKRQRLQYLAQRGEGENLPEPIQHRSRGLTINHTGAPKRAAQFPHLMGTFC
jgi:hypothetical protein